MVAALLPVFFLAPCAAAATYRVSCNGAPDIAGGTNAPLPFVKFESEITTRPARDGEFVCNAAAGAPASQQQFVITSSPITVHLQQGDRNDYFTFSTKPTNDFGACDLAPVSNEQGEELAGRVSVPDEDVVCLTPDACGRYGLINPGDLDNQITSVQFGFNYRLNTLGHMQLVDLPWYPASVLIEYIPLHGDHYPFEGEYQLTSCTFEAI